MANRVWMPRALDANGDVVSGAQAYFYQQGTTTPANVYTDSTLATAHPSPLVADSSGAFAEVYIASAVKVDIQDGSGVSLPGFPSDDWYTTSTAGTAASTITHTPSVENPATDVQTALDNVTAVQAAQSTLGRNLIGNTTEADMRTTLGLGSIATTSLIDEDDMVSDTAAQAPTQQSVKAYVDTQIPAVTAGWDYTSAETAIAAGAAVTFTHGLGVAPTKLSFDLVCKTADGNFAVGDVILGYASESLAPFDSGCYVMIPAGSTTQIKLVIGSGGLGAIDPVTFAEIGLTESSWNVVMKASK